MKYNYLIITFTFMFFYILSTLVATSEEASKEFFPLREGSYWIYSGNVKWQNGLEIVEENLIWKMEVAEVIKSKDITVAVLKGHPGDLSWYEEGKERGNYLIIKIGDNKYYRLDNKIQEVLDRLEEEKDISDLLTGFDLFLDLPLTGQKAFGDPTGVEREDKWYCWFVESIDEIELNIKGIDKGTKANRYRLVYRTLSDHTIVEFIPEVGITGYEYIHHGTTSESHLELIEYFKVK